jgi:Ca-activated chloride channel family protein
VIAIDTPLLLWLAPVLAIAVGALAWWARRARVSRARRWSETLARSARKNHRGTWAWLGLAALAAGVALAGPRWGRQVVTSETQALDLVIAVDLSRSMLAEDVPPSRLGRAQAQIRRLVHDLAGDRVGLIGFAGRSFILSPLTGDESALLLLADALHPDLVSAGGSGLSAALRQGRELLLASDRVADRVLVLFTDGEAHDSLPDVLDAADRIRRDGVRLILVAEGGTEPVRIPVRAPSGELLGPQEDVDGTVIMTRRRDDVLTAAADAAQGVLVAAALDDQAGAVRELVAGYQRAPARVAATTNQLPRGWVPLSLAVLLLVAHVFTRRSAALAALLLGAALPVRLSAQGPQNRADEAWRAGQLSRAADEYLAQARAGVGGDTAWYNAGTALLAVKRYPEARDALLRAVTSLDPDVRFRALYNLGLTALRMAETDRPNRDAHRAEARARYREALLLRPGDQDTKWNLELALDPPPPGSGGGGGGTPPPPSSGEAEAPPMPDLSRDQAEQILESIAAEERRTRQDLRRRAAQMRDTRRVRDW